MAIPQFVSGSWKPKSLTGILDCCMVCPLGLGSVTLLRAKPLLIRICISGSKHNEHGKKLGMGASRNPLSVCDLSWCLTLGHFYSDSFLSALGPLNSDDTFQPNKLFHEQKASTTAYVMCCMSLLSFPWEKNPKLVKATISQQRDFKQPFK